MSTRLTIFSLLALQAGGAPPPERSPSDVELASAYCIGILQSHQTANEAALKTPTRDMQATIALRADYANVTKRLFRLRSYLVPLAVMLDTAALEAEVQRATVDAAASKLATGDKPSGSTLDPRASRRARSCLIDHVSD